MAAISENQPKPLWRKRTLAGKLLALSAVLLGLCILAGVAGALLYGHDVTQSWETPNLAVPVVVIESDDWGLDYEPSSFVPPGEALDARQTAGVARLVKVLEHHRDSVGRKPIVSAFIVVRQADTPAIAKDPQFRYHARPIDEVMPRTVAALKQAAEAGVFSLAYHGRDHRDAGLWAQNVRHAVQQARRENKPFDPAIVATFHPDDPRGRDMCIAEYFDSRRGYLEKLDPHVIDEKVASGLAEFERIFHKKAASTVPPRYLWGPGAEAAFGRHGIRYVHGVNKQGGRFRDSPDVWSRRFGVRLSDGLVGIPRNTDVEVAKDGTPPSPAEVLDWAGGAVSAGQPVVICTHACNYCSASAELSDGMAKCLDDCLGALERRYTKLRYLSAQEAGQLAQTGKVSVSLGDSRTADIKKAKGLRHAWLGLKGLYLARPKARLYLRGLAGLALLTAATGLAWLVSGRIRRRRGREA